MTLPGSSRTIIVQPLEEPVPAKPEPDVEPAPPEREREIEPEREPVEAP